MKSLDFLNEGIAEDAHEMHLDHEVQMARQELYHAAEDAIALHKLLRHVSEQQGLEGWVSSKITLAADYLNTVREHLEYQLMSGGPDESVVAVVGNSMPVAEDKQSYTSAEMVDILSGAKTQAQVDADRKAASQQQTTTTPQPAPQQPAKKVNERKSKGMAKGRTMSEGQMKKQMEADAERMELEQFLDRYVHRPEDKEWVSEFWRNVNGEDEQQVNEMSAGGVATVVNPTPKNKAKVGTLFGGTYKQKQTKAK
jgi:hypothetical protein